MDMLGPNPMTGVLKRRENRDTDTQGRIYEDGAEMVHLQAKENQRLPATTKGLKRRILP